MSKNLSTETLTFESARALSALYGDTPSLLPELETALGVKITTRDAWLKLEGSEKAIADTRELFRILTLASQKSVKIRQHEFRFALQAVKAGRAPDLESLWNLRLQFSPRKATVIPKTFTQRAYVDLIRQNALTFGIGPAGTGKTFLAVAMALSALKNEEVNRIVLTRPAVEAGESLGYLPGDLEEKILPYLRPLYDALQDLIETEELERHLERGVVEIAPLAYMRGRTLANSFVILDEGQNTTTEQMFMFLTRLGQNSRCVVTGDPTQTDLPPHRKSGLVEAVQALHHVEGIGFQKFEDVDIVRHELVTKIVQAYKKHRGEKQTSIGL
ncbi:MAG: PhoH family protein [Blastochloris sp.]|nr:PhoH family protein [Blastochloris sp.]